MPLPRRRPTARVTALALAAGALVAPQLGAHAAVAAEPAAQLAFTVHDYVKRTSSIYVSDLDGGNRRVVATDPGGTFWFTHPALSPDGTEIAYVSAYSAVPEEVYFQHIWVRKTDGTGTPRQLTNVARHDTAPTWSPDGGTIAFAGWDGRECDDLILVPAAGGQARRLPEGECGYAPAYSPSGRQIAFTTQDANRHIDVISSSGLYRTPVTGTRFALRPHWSPDGQQIAFSYLDPAAPNVSELRTVPVRGASPTTLVPAGGSLNQAPRYSPDGTRIYFDRCTVAADGETCPGDLWSVTPGDPGSAAVVRATPQDEYAVSVSGPPIATPDTTAPAAVTALVVESVADSSARLKWQGPSNADLSHFLVTTGARDAPPPTSPSEGRVLYAGRQPNATIGDLGNGLRYLLSVFAMDAAGNASEPVHISVIPMRAPEIVLPLITASVTSGLPFPVQWQSWGSEATYDVSYTQRLRNAQGQWYSTAPTRWLSNTPTTSATFGQDSQPLRLTDNRQFSFFVRARNSLGQTTAATSALAVVPIDDASPALGFSDKWVTRSNPRNFLGGYRGTMATGQTMTLTTSTNRFVVIGNMCPTCGVIDFYVDGVRRHRMDTGGTFQARRTLFAIFLPPFPRQHTLKIVTRGAGRAGPGVQIDAVGFSH